MAADKKVVFKVTVEADGANATVRDLKGRIVNTQVSVAALRKEFGNFSVNAKKSTEIVGKSVDQLKGRVKSAKTSMGTLSKGLDGVSKSSGAAAATTLELGRVISDAPYGIRGMANNVSQVASQLAFMSRSTDIATGKVIGFSGAIKGVWTSMMGPLGILLAVQAVIAALDYFAGSTKKAVEEVESLNASSGRAASNLKILKESIELGTISQEEAIEAVKTANEEYDDLNIVLDENNELTEDSVVAIDAKIESLERLAKALALQKLIEDAYSKLLPLEIKQTELVTKAKLAEARAVNALSQSYREAGTATAESSARSARNAVEEGQKAIDELKKGITELLGVAGEEGLVSELFKGKKDKNSKKPKKDKRPKQKSVNELLTGDELDEEKENQKKRVDALFNDKFDLENENNNALLEQNLLFNESILNNETLFELERTNTAKKGAEERKQTQLKYLEAVGGGLQALSEIAGQETAAGKALAVAGATIDTYAAISGQLAAFSNVPVPGYAIAQAVTTGLFGLANVKKILETSVPGGGGGVGGGGSIPSAGRTFDFNLAGSTGQNQLAQTIGGQVAQPIKAYVVSSEITNQQQFDNQIQGEVTIG